MKIHLSEYWRKSSLCNLCVLIFVAVGAAIFYLYYRRIDGEAYLILLLAFPLTALECALLLFSKRLLNCVVVEGKIFCSCSIFNKKLCILDIEKPTFYAVFESPEGGRPKQFIAMSNEPFEYRATFGRGKIRFIQHYDTKKVVVLPYNDSTKPLLNLEQWNNVNHVVTSPFEMDVWPYLMIGIPSVGGFAVLNFGEIFFVVLFVLSAIFLWKNESKKFAQYYKSKYPMEYLRMCKQKCYKAQLEFKPTAQDEILERNQKQFKTMLRYEMLAPICFVICIIAKLFAL